jgi:hypothetical protein
VTRRVLSVVDHQRPGREPWTLLETSITNVTTMGDQAAQEVAERLTLAKAPVLRQGRRVRVRIYPAPAELEALLAHDPDAEPAEGAWICEPGPDANAEVRS